MLNKHCPHCKKLIQRDDLLKTNRQKAYLARKVVNCPHCEHAIQLPPVAEKLVSTGLLFSVIAAPLMYYWFRDTLANVDVITGCVFALGIVLLLIGIGKNQPRKSSESSQNTTHHSEQ